MKKSMLAFASCALVAGAVMAATVEGNNTAVVIQKEPVVSTTLYQFLIVPVKPFDITNSANASTIPLNELLPPAGYGENTIVYSATAENRVTYKVNAYGEWTNNGVSIDDNVTFSTGDILWLKTATEPTDPTVFCGELSADEVTVTPVAGQFVAFGNATSTAVEFAKINAGAGGFITGDQIYLVQKGSSDYLRLVYNGNEKVWMKPPAGSGRYVPVESGKDVFPAGAAAYYYRK